MAVPRDDRWRVEAVQLDRGTGLRTWFEIHHADEVWYRPTVTGLAAFLAERHIDPAQLAPPDGASPDGDDGCE